MQSLLRYEYLVTERETAVRITIINEYMFKNKGVSLCQVTLLCRCNIYTAHKCISILLLRKFY